MLGTSYWRKAWILRSNSKIPCKPEEKAKGCNDESRNRHQWCKECWQNAQKTLPKDIKLAPSSSSLLQLWANLKCRDPFNKILLPSPLNTIMMLSEKGGASQLISYKLDSSKYVDGRHLSIK